MKKVIKIFLVLLLVILIAAASVTVWKWKTIKNIYLGVTLSEDEISARMSENKASLAEAINNYLDVEVREMTPEEKKQIEDGEATAEEIYLKIYQEAYENAKKEKNPSGNNSVSNDETIADKNDSGNASEDKVKPENKKDGANKQSGADKQSNTGKQDSENKKVSAGTKDEIVNKYVSQLYGLQGKYTAQAEATIAEGKSYYRSLRRAKTDKVTARTKAINQYAPIARSIQAQCDAEVSGVIAGLESELKAIGAETDIVGTIRSAYENEKQLKISYYSGQYLN